MTAIVTLVQVISVIIGVVISIVSFNAARQKDAEVRQAEAAAPFFELRQKTYQEAAKMAGILTNPEIHTAEELAAAKKRFRELYVVELSMVEAKAVEQKMVALAELIDPELEKTDSGAEGRARSCARTSRLLRRILGRRALKRRGERL